ncbi:MAG TPA: hypothetical protein VF710_22865, partial [Longimicrobium sp.]
THTSRDFKKPYEEASFTAKQRYRYRTPCKNGNAPVDITGVIPITREVTQASARKFKYTATKSGVSSSRTLP